MVKLKEKLLIENVNSSNQMNKKIAVLDLLPNEQSFKTSRRPELKTSWGNKGVRQVYCVISFTFQKPYKVLSAHFRCVTLGTEKYLSVAKNDRAISQIMEERELQNLQTILASLDTSVESLKESLESMKPTYLQAMQEWV